MTDDTKILSAILTLHERFVEAPSEFGASHLWKFAGGSLRDVTAPGWTKLLRYIVALEGVVVKEFSPKSIAHLNEVAKECLG